MGNGKVNVFFRLGISILSLAYFLAVGFCNPGIALEESRNRKIFSTWEGFEVDKCASIWLIKRFIDEEAIFRFFPKGHTIKEGITFDTPDAKFKRTYNMSTFESLMRHFRINDPKVAYISKIINDAEINIWEQKKFKETRMVLDAIGKIVAVSQTHEEVILKSCKFFDDFYKKIQVSTTKNSW